jgi:hypothetical protein
LESALTYSSTLAGIISLKDMMKFFELKVELEPYPVFTQGLATIRQGFFRISICSLVKV